MAAARCRTAGVHARQPLSLPLSFAHSPHLPYLPPLVQQQQQDETPADAAAAAAAVPTDPVAPPRPLHQRLRLRLDSGALVAGGEGGGAKLVDAQAAFRAGKLTEAHLLNAQARG